MDDLQDNKAEDLQEEPNSGTELEATDSDSDKDWKAEAEKWKTHARKWQIKSETNFTKAKTFDEVSSKLSTLEGSLNAIQEENLLLKKKEVVTRFSLPEKVLTRLQGSTLEELEADAAEWKTILGEAPADTKESKQKAKPVPTQGTDTETKTKNESKVKTKEEFLESLKARKN